ncbi:MAG TPA: HemK/PrmC family methyltransferase [Candidatus Limnocylindrales bacterium]|nr:HemK/PrmC family methyltransferase [Candidatus Limnocylindrales bacterium]
MTVLEAIQKSTGFLGKKNVESPRLQAELLLTHLLKMPRMKLYLNFERVLTTAETDALRELIKRRGQREPLQHITGSTSFCGFEIAVTGQALVPRPETELLAELGWKFLSTFNLQPSTALYFGTGTGCIAIALAAKCPNAKIVALDISTDALALAKANAARNQVAERIEFLPGDGFAALQSAGRVPRVPDPTGETKNGDSWNSSLRKLEFDLLISNPPYIPSAEIATLDAEVRDFDPRLALDGGADGLDFYRKLATEAKSFLKLDGKIMVEFGDGQADGIKRIFENEKWIVEAVKEDYSQRARILIARR